MLRLDSHHEGPAPAIAALLLVEICLGYEWFVSGLTKIVHGNFPQGLAGQLADLGKGAPGWYRGLLTNAIEPHAQVVGYGIEAGELLVGLVLIGAAAVWLVGGARLPERRQQSLQLLIGAASVLAIVLLVNFELANGAGFGMRLGADSFDEGIDLDTIMIGLHVALLTFVVTAMPAARRAPQLARST